MLLYSNPAASDDGLSLLLVFSPPSIVCLVLIVLCLLPAAELAFFSICSSESCRLLPTLEWRCYYSRSSTSQSSTNNTPLQDLYSCTRDTRSPNHPDLFPIGFHEIELRGRSYLWGINDQIVCSALSIPSPLQLYCIQLYNESHPFTVMLELT